MITTMDESGAPEDTRDPHEDSELHAELTAANFVGVRFELFREEMWSYGQRVLAAWMYDGSIGMKARIELWDKEVSILARSQELRDELAMETLMKVDQWWFAADADYGLRTWDPYRGAALRTFFVGACLGEFPNIARKWRTARLREANLAAELMKAVRDDHTPGPEEAVELRHILRQIMGESSKEQQAICWYIYSGDLTYKEIGSKLGGMTSRAVEGQMRRLRLSAKLMSAGGVIDVPGRFLPSPRTGSSGTQGDA